MKKVVKKIKKNISLDDLGGMIESLAVSTAKGFARVDGRFEEVDRRFDQIDRKFSKIEGDMFNLDTKVQAIDTRLRNVEKALEPITLSYGVFSREIRDMNLRISNLEKKVGIKIK